MDISINTYICQFTLYKRIVDTHNTNKPIWEERTWNKK